MKRVYLVGEEHSLDGKDIMTLGLLKQIEQDAKFPLRGISFELAGEIGGGGDFDFIVHFANRRGLELYASDIREFAGFDLEKKIKAGLEGNPTPALVDQYRILSKQNMDIRDNHAAKMLNSYFNGSPTSLVHICGIDHVRGLETRLKRRGISVEKILLTTPKDVVFSEGDLLYSLSPVIAHGVAAYDIEDMGTGVAEMINHKWPHSYKRFKKLRRSNPFRPGDVLIDFENNPAIAYLATQPDLYHAETRYVSKALRTLRKELESRSVVSCALPRIGCGYGKLEWKEVKPRIVERLGGSFVTFNVIEEFKK